MRTSSDEDESETLFPSANDPPLGENMASSTIFPTELSPPTSQDPPDPTEWEGYQDGNSDSIPPDAPSMERSKAAEGRSGEIYGLNGDSSHIPFKESHEHSGAENEPGYAWRNPKAVEEYHKAMEQVTDRGFSLSERPSLHVIDLELKLMVSTEEFGDPFDERKKGRENGSPETL